METGLGVTEPSAIALACSSAYQQVKGELENIVIVTDPGIFKNAFSCAIPGTEEAGIAMAALLGVVCGNPSLELEIFKDITAAQIGEARRLNERNLVEIQVQKDIPELYVNAFVKTAAGTGRTVIRKKHTNIVRIEADDHLIFEKEKETALNRTTTFDLSTYTVGQIKKFIDRVPLPDIDFVLSAVRINNKLCREGTGGAGMKAGFGLERLVRAKKIADDLVSYAQRLTGFAMDARMGGVSRPALCICGSGAHGIIATMPLAAAAERMTLEDDRLARAIALSYLITIYIKDHSGRLSAFCGCAVAAGIGASAGLVYLLGGGLEQIENAINNMAANITGLICDGGNYGCSLKAINGAGTAVLSALLALDGIAIPGDEGIVGRTVEETMKNIGLIASPGMVETNNTIIDIMMGKDRSGR